MTQVSENYKELKEILVFGFSLQDAITRTLEDRKVTWLDVFKFSSVVPTIKPAFENAGNPIERFKSLATDEKARLIEELKLGFDIPNDEVEELIEQTLNVVVTNIELGKRWASIGKAA
jgi:hypothetical protein